MPYTTVQLAYNAVLLAVSGCCSPFLTGPGATEGAFERAPSIEVLYPYENKYENK
jgi:hypothetical protein